MLAMQYGFDLPDEFDMDAVRNRVAEIGSRFDGLPGLHLKAFLVAGKTGSAPNRYAPFYLWRESAGMTAFLMSESFRAVEAKYGRPMVRSWSPVAELQGRAAAGSPRFATQQFIDVPPGTDLVALAASERETAASMARDTALHSVFVGLDAHSWQLNRTALWRDEPVETGGARTFEVRYLATGSVAAPIQP